MKKHCKTCFSDIICGRESLDYCHRTVVEKAEPRLKEEPSTRSEPECGCVLYKKCKNYLCK